LVEETNGGAPSPSQVADSPEVKDKVEVSVAES